MLLIHFYTQVNFHDYIMNILKDIDINGEIKHLVLILNNENLSDAIFTH